MTKVVLNQRTEVDIPGDDDTAPSSVAPSFVNECCVTSFGMGRHPTGKVWTCATCGQKWDQQSDTFAEKVAPVVAAVPSPTHPRHVFCVQCGATSGNPCVTTSGARFRGGAPGRRTLHAARVDVYEAQTKRTWGADGDELPEPEAAPARSSRAVIPTKRERDDRHAAAVDAAELAAFNGGASHGR